MKRAVRRIADIFGVYARKQGWWPLDFRLYFRADEAWGRIHATFVSDGFEGRDNLECYQEILNFLRQRTMDSPDLAKAVGLVVCTFKQVEEGGIYAIGANSTFVRPRDLVKLTIRETVGLVAGYAKTQGWNEQDYRILFKAIPDQSRVECAVLVKKTDDRRVDERMISFHRYANSRLSEEPEILNTLDLEIEADDNSEFLRLQGAGYEDYWAFHKIRSTS